MRIALAFATRFRGVLDGRGGRMRWIALAVLAALALAIASIAWLACVPLGSEQVLLRTQIRSMQTFLADGAKVNHATGLAPTNFAQRLPAVVDLQTALLTLQRSTAEAGVEFVGVQIQQRAAAKEVLPRADLMVSLRGNYPKLQQVLADALGCCSNVTLVRASMRRAAPPDQLEATLAIGVWGAPLASAVTASAPVMLEAR